MLLGTMSIIMSDMLRLAGPTRLAVTSAVGPDLTNRQLTLHHREAHERTGVARPAT
jgi:hypothetical protein